MNKDDKEKLDAEVKRMESKAAAKAKMDDPIVTVEFRNLEDPPTAEKPSPDLKFTFEGTGYGPLKDGQVYEIPLSVANHLNGCRVPVYKQQVDPETGLAESKPAGTRARFSCAVLQTPAIEPVKRGRKVKNNGE